MAVLARPVGHVALGRVQPEEPAGVVDGDPEVLQEGVAEQAVHRLPEGRLERVGKVAGDDGRVHPGTGHGTPAGARIDPGHSDHPVSKAIATGLNLPENGLTDFVALAGRGIEARADGQLLVLGNHRLIEERALCSAEIEARLQVHETQGRTVTMLATEQQVLAIFAVADTIKESSREAVADLHRLGVVSVMLTGDNAATAASIAKEAGIDDARGNLLPEDKLAAIEDLQHRYGPTAMTGDGINDAPALARADIGVAMGAAGTDTAMEAADVVIMNDDLRRIPETIRLSRRTHAVLWQNIGLALGIKAIFLGLAIFGNATMWMAVFADMGASLLVVGNGVRLLRK